MNENQNPNQLPEDDPLFREAQGEPWVLDAIIKREDAAKRVADAGGTGSDVEAEQEFSTWTAEVEFRKLQMGITEPEPPSVESDE